MWLDTSYPHPNDVPPERWRQMMLSRAQYEAMVRERAARDAHAPKPGQPAPDFEIERLSPAGARTGTTFRLSSSRGRPVGLVFGSYT